ncbi:MAG TPA: ankyrin repeat domain-containing protein, partial [Candidatus Wallbacteria bacterium]|nr:ankyrin repeat domain-containing protein [Candidatus Wallbacteria bacterium]
MKEENYGSIGLIWAISGGHIDLVKMMLTKDIDINSADPEGLTPLMHAVISGNFHLVKLLLENGAGKDAKDKAGFDALMYAKAKNSPETID